MHMDKGALLVKECFFFKYFVSFLVCGIQKTWSKEALISRFEDISQFLKKFYSETHAKLSIFSFAIFKLISVKKIAVTNSVFPLLVCP